MFFIKMLKLLKYLNLVKNQGKSVKKKNKMICNIEHSALYKALVKEYNKTIQRARW